MPPKPPFNGSRDGTKWWTVYTKLRTYSTTYNTWSTHLVQSTYVCAQALYILIYCTYIIVVGYTHTYTHMYVVQDNRQDKLTCRCWAKTVCDIGWRAPIGHSINSDFNIGVWGLVVKDNWRHCSLEEEDDDKRRYACAYCTCPHMWPTASPVHSQIQPSHWF